jgi:Zinc finger C-x8-C-x5-C-x3-H type (and similar)
MHLRPDTITMNSHLKAIANSRTGFTMEEIIEWLNFFCKEWGLAPDKYTFGQLLLACKRKKDVERAYMWFDQLITAGVEASEMLCNVFRDTIGIEKYNQYYELHHDVIEHSCAKSKTGKTNRTGGAPGGTMGTKANMNRLAKERIGASQLRGPSNTSGAAQVSRHGFAHGAQSHGRNGGQLRPPSQSTPSCRHWAATGSCKFGSTCSFSHG